MHVRGARGHSQLYIDDNLVGQEDVPMTTPIAFNPGALTCGANPESPVTPDHKPPVMLTGTLHRVTVDLSGDLIRDDEAEMRLHPIRQ